MDEELDIRYGGLMFLVVLSFAFLMVGLLKLAWIKGSYYRSLARNNRIRQVIIPAGRGKILDRKGRVMAETIFQFVKDDGDEWEELVDEFDGDKLVGEDTVMMVKRKYNYGLSSGLVLGYVGKPDKQSLQEDKCQVGLTGEDEVGKSGVEQAWDCYLRGMSGKRLLEIDAKGDYLRELGRQEPESGKDLKLSLDAYWQKKIYEMLGGKKAVVIMSDPKTGKILTMVSSPSIDSNVFSYKKNDEQISAYLADEDKPMLNRAIGAAYQPGSVFKMVVAVAGLEEGVIDGDTLIEDTGVITLGDYSYKNWLWTKKGTTDGMVDVVKGLKRSNDIFFYRLGEKLGVDNIKVWAFRFGFGDRTGIGLVNEEMGIVPDEQWKQETRGEPWFLGNTYHLAIGQGDLLATPLQISQMTNIVANDGVKCKMSILQDEKTDCEQLPIELDDLTLIKKGMYQACHEGGTAWPLFNFKTELACKTGTAQVGDGSDDTHAWLTAYGPVDNPQISVTVLVERGGEGSDVAAPIVGDILKEWFEEAETLVPRYGADGKVVYE